MREPLPPSRRRSLKLTALRAAIAEMFAHPMVRLSIIVQTLSLTSLFASITMIQQIFDVSFGRAESFPFWFALIALISGTSSAVNAALVMRFGMRKMVSSALGVQVVLSSGMIALSFVDLTEPTRFTLFLIWQTSVFFQAGLCLGNLNALAMEPMGHIAGMAASTMGAIATLGSALLAAPIGLMFNGTPMPVFLGVFVTAFLGFLITLRMQRLERPLLDA